MLVQGNMVTPFTLSDITPRTIRQNLQDVYLLPRIFNTVVIS